MLLEYKIKVCADGFILHKVEEDEAEEFYSVEDLLSELEQEICSAAAVVQE